MTMTETAARTLAVPGATLAYDVRGGGPPGDPMLFLIGSPMGASGFGTLAGHFPDRTVLTYDPRGADRSAKDDPSTPSTPEQHADDVHRIIQEVGAGPVDLFASSGGAVNALALVARYTGGSNPMKGAAVLLDAWVAHMKGPLCRGNAGWHGPCWRTVPCARAEPPMSVSSPF